MGGKKYFSVDKVEENLVLLENRQRDTFNVSINLFGDKVRKGDIVYLEGGKYIFDLKETERMRKQILELQNELLKED